MADPTATPKDALRDAAGKRHPPAGPGARIVSLVPSITELIVDLGLGDQLVGRTHYCVHPAERLAAIPSVGGTKKVNMARLAALAPTHVILNIDENTREMAAAIEGQGIETVITHPIEPEDNRALYALMGAIFGREAEAAALSVRLGEALGRARAAARRLPPKHVVYFIWNDPWMTVSRDTYIARMLALAGWQTLCHDPATRYPEVAITPALVAEADLFLFSSEPYAFRQDDLHAFAERYGAPAEKLALIDGEYCSWYGSRAIAGLDYLAGFVAARAG